MNPFAKKFGLLILCGLVMLSWFGAESAEAGLDDSLHIIIDTDFFDADPAPVETSGRTLVPVRALGRALHFEVVWQADTQAVLLKHHDCTIKLTIGKTTASVNGNGAVLDTPPQLIQGKAMVPLRFVAETLGYNVLFDYLNDVTPVIWVTKFNLLSAEEVVAVTDQFEVAADEAGPPCYKLKPDGITQRGIKLGDSLEKVRAAYGTPARENLDSTLTGSLVYWSRFLPRSGALTVMVFAFDRGVLTGVTISSS